MQLGNEIYTEQIKVLKGHEGNGKGLPWNIYPNHKENHAGIIGVKGGVRVWLNVNMGISWVSGASTTILGNVVQLEAA